MFALLFNLDFTEIAIILIGAILLFGRNLPQVAMRGAAQFVRLRRQLMQVWREAGFEEELRKAQRELETSVPKLPPPKSFFDSPPRTDPPASTTAAATGLAAAHVTEQGAAGQAQGPDEDPDHRAEWEREDPYGPVEEEARAADTLHPSQDKDADPGDASADQGPGHGDRAADPEHPDSNN